MPSGDEGRGRHRGRDQRGGSGRRHVAHAEGSGDREAVVRQGAAQRGEPRRSGGGGGGVTGSYLAGKAGGSGVVILKVPSTYYATFSSGVTYSFSSAVSGYNIYTVTATSTTSETVTFSSTAFGADLLVIAGGGGGGGVTGDTGGGGGGGRPTNNTTQGGGGGGTGAITTATGVVPTLLTILKNGKESIKIRS